MRKQANSIPWLTPFTWWRVVGLWVLMMAMIGSAQAMIYKPDSGLIWDPSILFHDGKYYMFSMYCPLGGQSHHVGSAVSNDGVHWKDTGIVITFDDREDNGIYKPFIAKVGDRFILNHGAFSKQGVQNRIPFWESKDLRQWSKLYESKPDPRWYNETARWDDMYTLPKEEGNPKAGYWGYLTAVPTGELSNKGHMEGMMESKDGVHWEAIAPPVFDFGKFQRVFLDSGGVERIGEKYYFIGCSGPYNGNWNAAMYTFVSDSPTGPFVADAEAFRLSGTSGLPSWPHVTCLAAWARDKDGSRLISNYGPALDGTVWMQPLKKAVVDKGHHLRLAYWLPNDAVKGSSLSLALDQCKLVYPAIAEVTPKSENKQAAPDASYRVNVSEHGAVLEPAQGVYSPFDDRPPMLALLAPRFNLEKGIVLEGTIQIDAVTGCRPGSGGFYIEEEPGAGTAIMMEVGHPAWRRTRISRLTVGDKISFDCVDETGPGCATVTGLDNGKSHSFRLWIRKNMFELYVDDMYVQTFLTRKMTGSIGFIKQNGKAVFDNLKVWEMNL